MNIEEFIKILKSDGFKEQKDETSHRGFKHDMYGKINFSYNAVWVNKFSSYIKKIAKNKNSNINSLPQEERYALYKKIIYGELENLKITEKSFHFTTKNHKTDYIGVLDVVSLEEILKIYQFTKNIIDNKKTK